MKKLFSALALAATVGFGAASAQASEGEVEIPGHDFSFEGIFGSFDREAAQRGLQVFNQVCSSCHGMKYVAFRTLEDLGYPENQIEGIAAQYTVTDGPNDQGEMYERPAKPNDTFPSPYANETAAENANGGAAPPDLSLITKARGGGSEYIRALLIGYEDAPEDAEMAPGQYWNKYFPGHKVGMPQMLTDGAVEYQDGTEATAEQMAADVATFLHWAAEPNLEARKRMGVKVIVFLLIFTGLIYAVKRKVWSDLH